MRTPPTHPLSLLARGIFASILLDATAGAQTIWNLANDFSLAENPNGAWTYQMEVTPGDDDTAYTPIADNTIHANTIWGTTFATPPVMRTEGTGFWGIGRNDTGTTQSSAAVTWAPGEVLFHPKPGFDGSGGRFVITWQAPANMAVDVAWAYAKRMTVGANGVGMSVLHESAGTNTLIRNWGNPEGAAGTFDNLAVTSGDKLQFRFDNWGDAGGDITWADITVTELSGPSPSIASFTANPGVLTTAGAPLTFDWQVEGSPLDSLVITPGDINVLPLTNASGTGSYTLNPAPSVNTEYTLTAIKGALTRQRKVFVIVRIVDPNAIFTGDFESFTAPAGNFNGGQFQSGLVVAHSGDVSGWTKAGGGTVHVVDRANLVGGSNPRDFAVMIWQDNVITQAAAVSGSNDSGAAYTVRFDAGPAVYQHPPQQTGATDGILIEVLRADNSVLATHIHLPGAWAGYPALAGGSFEYIGDGSGDVRLRIGPSAFGSGRFGGTIDNVSIAPATPVPFDLTGFTASPGVLTTAGDPVIFDWQVEGMPLDSLVITPGNIDVLSHTDPSGTGSYVLNPAPSINTEYTLTAIKGEVTRLRKVFVIVRIVDPNAILSADFESFTAPAGNFNGGQFQSGLVVAHSGDLTGWTKAGGGTVHVVDRANLVGGSNPRDFAVMIWENNVITQAAAVSGSNDSGAAYAVRFDAGPAVYQAPSQATGATDGILIEVLRADGSVLAAHTHLPGVWAGYPALAGGGFQYIGDGSGDVRLRIGPSAFGSGRFGGTIDNVSIAPATPVPFDLTSISRDPATGEITFTFASVNGVNYEVWATSNLEDPPAAWEQLEDELVGTGNSTEFTDSVRAPTRSQLFYQVRRP